MKRLTRRQARALLAPMRSCFAGMLHTGQAESIDGFAVTRVGEADKWERTDHCIAGFVALTDRLFPGMKTSAMTRVAGVLAGQQLVKPVDLQECMQELKEAEGWFISITRQRLTSAISTAQISFEMEALEL